MARRSRPGGNIRWKVGTDHLFWSVPVAMDCQSGHAIPWRPEMDSACFGESRVRVGSHSIGTKVVESSDPGGGKGKGDIGGACGAHARVWRLGMDSPGREGLGPLT